MISFVQALVIGLVQGITELFPVSSLGHSVLLPGLLGWSINQNADAFLAFLVATHLATALVLLVMYRRDWWRIAKGLGRSLAAREIRADDPDAKLGWLLVVSTIPAGVIGLLLKDQITGFFLSPRSAALFLIANGVLLALAELLRRRARAEARDPGTATDADARIAHNLSWRQAFGVGIMQVLALIPGFSRTGSTLAGGLMAGLSHEDALRYAFLLATPIIGAAAALELPPLVATADARTLGVTLAGAAAAALAAYGSARFLARYFKTKTLIPFAAYCAAIGIASLILIH
ncbi:MAG TPA: undecaprenyl-diphosphate phosphatase [Candidatus Paceibacterota bacterium]|nr:undecaprenyl-diphosphate phosphatase [Candidatus Paceibacterota bacterium]